MVEEKQSRDSIVAVQMLDKVLVMKPRRSHLVKSTPVETAIDTSIDNVYGEPQTR